MLEGGCRESNVILGPARTGGNAELRQFSSLLGTGVTHS